MKKNKEQKEEEKQERKELQKANRAFESMVRMLKDKGALIEIIEPKRQDNDKRQTSEH